MAFCTNCGHQLADGAKFCFECGVKVSTSSATEDNRRRERFDGEIHKCPRCGDILNAHELVCEACGYEVRGVQAIYSMKEFVEGLRQIEDSRPKKKNSLLKTLSGFEIADEIDRKKIEYIKNSAIPNTKEDIFEFVILSSSNIDLKVYGVYGMDRRTDLRRELSDAWLAKFEQACQKAQLMFGETPEAYTIKNMYQQKLAAIKNQKMQIFWLIFGIISAIALMFVFMGIFAF